MKSQELIFEEYEQGENLQCIPLGECPFEKIIQFESHARNE